MKIEEAIIYTLTSYGRGLTTNQLADIINAQRFYIRPDGNSVSSRQIYAVICQYPDIFVKDGGLIHLMM